MNPILKLHTGEDEARKVIEARYEAQITLALSKAKRSLFPTARGLHGLSGQVRPVLYGFLRQPLTELYLDAARLAVEVATYELPQLGYVALVNEVNVGWATGYTRETLDKMTQTTELAYRKAIREFYAGGHNLQWLRDKLETENNFGPLRAHRVAQTETTRGFNEHLKEIFRESGVTYVQYQHVADRRVCPQCESLDGMRVPLSEANHIPVHILCRCRWVAA